MNCSDEGSLGQALQGNFETVFPSADVKANEITDSILSVIIQTPSLDQTCKVRS